MGMSEQGEESSRFCESCHVGSLQRCRATYARWHGGQFVLMPGVPAWRCDYCGDTFYDNEALARIVLLVGVDSDAEVARGWRSAGLEDSPELGLIDRHRV
jgi:YgiT-type zinc finger domain-containing protein